MIQSPDTIRGLRRPLQYFQEPAIRRMACGSGWQCPVGAQGRTHPPKRLAVTDMMANDAILRQVARLTPAPEVQGLEARMIAAKPRQHL